MLVSVVVLNYNYAAYLEECVESALAQCYPHVEVIVVDDGSTDGSVALLDRYRGRVQVLCKDNGGMVSAMNRGFEASRGDIVLFLDADDFLLPDAVATHVEAFSDERLVRSQVYLRVHDGDRPTMERIPGAAAGHGDLLDVMLERGPGAYVSSPNSGNAWARRFLARVFPLPEEPRSIGGETYLMDAAPLFGAVAVTGPGPKAVYRMHGESMNGVLGAMTPRNIRRVIVQHEARVAWLARVAAALGYVARPAEWTARSWRMLTLQCLDGKHGGGTQDAPGGSRTRVPLGRHLGSAWTIPGGPFKRQLLALVILGIRIAPFSVGAYMAGRIINLKYM